MVRRGLATSRSEARDAISAGRVTVDGSPATKAGTMVAGDQGVAVAGPARPYVSRGGEKLAPALDRFVVDPRGRRCLDAGAATGGFTDVLLRRGAAQVVAVDVGYGQLAWRLRNDSRVTVLERCNVRDLRPEQLPEPVQVVVADLSFISLTKVLPALAGVADDDADLVLLVKPQFEAGREQVGSGGVVRDPAVRRRAVERVADACREHGLGPVAVMRSPITGPAGNVEVFLHAVRGRSGTPLDVASAVEEGPS